LRAKDLALSPQQLILRLASQSALVQSAAGGLKQLDEIAGRILQQDLRSARPRHDVIAELDAGGAQPRDLAREVVHDEVNAIPAARAGPLAISPSAAQPSFSGH
jgi:hypothetical protein